MRQAGRCQPIQEVDGVALGQSGEVSSSWGGISQQGVHWSGAEPLRVRGGLLSSWHPQI